MSKEPNSIACHVIDACGETFLHTVAGLDYEPKFREHARWWIRHRTRPGAWKDTDSAGRTLRQPVKPCRIVIERYHDPSSKKQ